MSQTLAASRPQAVLEEVPETQINVSVDFQGNVSVDKPFVRIPVDANPHRIKWNLQSDLPDVFFDHPAITFFGEPTTEVVRLQPQERTLDWFNANTDRQKRSFPYRIHLVQKVGEDYFPLVTDPIIHNDPPPDA